MKTQMTTQVMIDSIQRQLELLNNTTDLTHSQKRGALELISLELDEVLLLHENELDTHWRHYERYEQTLFQQVVKMERLIETCSLLLKHRNHNRSVERYLQDLNRVCREVKDRYIQLSSCRDIMRQPDDIPF